MKADYNTKLAKFIDNVYTFYTAGGGSDCVFGQLTKTWVQQGPVCSKTKISEPP